MMSKQLFFSLFALLLACTSCKKAIDRKKEQIVLNIMTNGRWYISQLKNDGADITSKFSGYEFQFYEAGTVDAIGTAHTIQGTWVGDIPNYSIATDFKASSDTLTILNETWRITDSDYDYVKASSPSGIKFLYLRKKS